MKPTPEEIRVAKIELAESEADCSGFEEAERDAEYYSMPHIMARFRRWSARDALQKISQRNTKGLDGRRARAYN